MSFERVPVTSKYNVGDVVQHIFSGTKITINRGVDFDKKTPPCDRRITGYYFDSNDGVIKEAMVLAGVTKRISSVIQPCNNRLDIPCDDSDLAGVLVYFHGEPENKFVVLEGLATGEGEVEISCWNKKENQEVVLLINKSCLYY